MDDRGDRIITAGPYELADDYHTRILTKVHMYTHIITESMKNHSEINHLIRGTLGTLRVCLREVLQYTNVLDYQKCPFGPFSEVSLLNGTPLTPFCSLTNTN